MYWNVNCGDVDDGCCCCCLRVGLRRRNARVGLICELMCWVSGVEIRWRKKEMRNSVGRGELGDCGGGFNSIEARCSASVTRFKKTSFVDS